MTQYVFPPIETPSVPLVTGDGLFPVRRIFCVGRNYREHVKEMGGDPERNPPFFFTKPADAIVADGAEVAYPMLTENFHHEIELVVAIGKTGRKVPKERANELIFGYATGIDLTRRDLQRNAMKAGHPWDFGKAFDQSAPCAPIHPISQTGVIERGRIWLSVNDQIRQDADVSDLIWSVPEIISILSHGIELRPGDLIYTGTPEGVGSLVAGDEIRGSAAGLTKVSITVGPEV